MTALFRIWTAHSGVLNTEDIVREEWTRMQEAAGFQSVSGRSACDLLCDMDGHLWIIDTCDGAHHVDHLKYLASPLPADERLRSVLQSIASLSAPECGLAPEMARKALE